MERFENECTCTVCDCTYLPGKGEPTDRCKAHKNLSSAVEEKVKYLHQDISVSKLADRLEVLERDVADLKAAQKPAGFQKVCEDCGNKFTATAPAVKKCSKCKKGS